MAPITVQPLPELNGIPRGSRLEIDEFIADNDMTNVFLLALSALQKNSLQETNGQPDWKKYYALAGKSDSDRDAKKLTIIKVYTGSLEMIGMLYQTPFKLQPAILKRDHERSSGKAIATMV